MLQNLSAVLKYRMLAYLIGVVAFGAIVLLTNSPRTYGDHFSNVPEVKGTGVVKEKYRIEERYIFVILVGDTYQKDDTINVDVFHKTDVGDKIDVVVSQEHDIVSAIGFFLIVFSGAGMFLAGGAYIFVVVLAVGMILASVGIAIPMIYLLGVPALILLPILIREVLNERLASALSENKTIKTLGVLTTVPLISRNTPASKTIWFRFVYTYNGWAYLNKEDLVVDKLKGD